MPRVTGYPALLAAVIVLVSCRTSSTTGASSPASTQSDSKPQSSRSSPVSAGPTTFTSANYGYTVTVPAGWTSRQAFEKWDIHSELDGTSILVDLFGEPSVTRGAFAAAARWKQDLAAFTTYLIASTAHYHEFCPHRPNRREPVTVGGEPGVLLAYNCGILVNMAAIVHDGVGYLFTFVDQGVAAATDPTDHATFQRFLKSVEFSR